MIFFLMNLVKGSLQDELDCFFKAVHAKEVSTRTVTKSAFTKARKKLHHQAFIELGRNIISFFYDHFPCRKWKGFRILAIDGSTIKVPRIKECADHFGAWNPAKGEACPLAGISTLFDALNGIVVDAVIRSKEQGERSLAAEHMQHVKANDLVLLDRGYPRLLAFRFDPLQAGPLLRQSQNLLEGRLENSPIQGKMKQSSPCRRASHPSSNASF